MASRRGPAEVLRVNDAGIVRPKNNCKHETNWDPFQQRESLLSPTRRLCEGKQRASLPPPSPEYYNFLNGTRAQTPPTKLGQKFSFSVPTIASENNSSLIFGKQFPFFLFTEGGTEGEAGREGDRGRERERHPDAFFSSSDGLVCAKPPGALLNPSGGAPGTPRRPDRK